MGSLCLPEQFKIVEALKPQTNAGALTSDYVSLKNVNMAWIVVNLQQANAATLALTVNEATLVDGTGTTAILKTFPIWSNLDTAASDSLVKRTAAASYTTDAGVKNKIVVIQIDPAILSAGFDVICFMCGASNAANIVGALYVLQTRYGQDGPPAAITD